MSETSPTMARIAVRLREFREARGLSQRQLARIVGRARSLVSYVEEGSRVVNVTTLEALAKALGVTVAELVDDRSVDAGQNDAHREIVPEECRWLVAQLRMRSPEFRRTVERLVKIMDRFAGECQGSS